MKRNPKPRPDRSVRRDMQEGARDARRILKGRFWNIQPPAILRATLSRERGVEVHPPILRGWCPDGRCGEHYVTGVAHPKAVNPDKLDRCPTCLATLVLTEPIRN